MQPHVKIYFEAFGYDQADFIPCELCGSKSVDIHHIEPRSKFGRTSRFLQNNISNLVALCRECHDKAHGELLRMVQGIIERKRSQID